MPRFFSSGNDVQSSDSEPEEEASEEETSKPMQLTGRATAYLHEESSSDEEVVVKRVVKSQKDKLNDEMTTLSNSIKNHIKINDWNAIHTDFNKLTTLVQGKTVQKEGIPRMYVKILAQLEDFLKKTMDNKEAKKKMSSSNSKSLNTMKQKLKKNNKQYETQIEEYRKNPDKDHDEASKGDREDKDDEAENEQSGAEDVHESEDEPAPAPSAPAPASKSKKSFWMTGNDDEAESDDDEVQKPSAESSKVSKWLKKDDDKEKKVAPAPVKDKKKKKQDKKHDEEEEEEEEEEVEKKAAEEKEKEDKKPAEKEEEVTKESVDKKLREIIAHRGKKGYDRKKQVDRLEALLAKAQGIDQEISILVSIIAAQFDIVASMATHMPVALWKSALTNCMKIVELLKKDRSIVLVETEDTTKTKKAPENQTLVIGNLVAFTERLDDELIKSLQYIDPHTQEYVDRLHDEQQFLELCEVVQTYYARINQNKLVARVAIRRMEHLYYKLDRPEDKKASKEEDKKKEKEVDTSTLLSKLATIIFQNGDERLKARAMLCHIYHHALHERFYEARDMMLLSHLQETIVHMDIPTQILFNRTTVQLGLCAFKNGLISDAHACLSELYSAGRVKELLAQGVTNARFSEKSQEQEKLEKRRQVPYHMHINLELLECVHYISAMLLEVPNMAANAFDVKKKVISRPFRRLLDYFDRQVFNGPPENTRDYVIAAAKAMMKGHWKKCEELLLSLSVWNLMPNPEVIKTMLRRKIQEEALRTYLFTYSQHYDSLSLEELSALFDLPKNIVHSLVSKMMIAEELHASWDQPTGTIVMHKVEPTRLQSLALQFSDKAAVFLENNERLLSGGSAQQQRERDQNQGQKSQSRSSDSKRQYDSRRKYERAH